MAQPRVLQLTIAIVPFPGDTYRAACKVGGSTFYSNAARTESAAAQDLLAQLGASGPFGQSASLAFDLELMGTAEIAALLDGGGE
jgi:hypothetical protein